MERNGRKGEERRFTSTLINGTLLIDVTKSVLDSIDDPSAVTDVAFTHSHSDHFDIESLKALAPCNVYAHESWANEISGEGLKVHALRIAEPVSTSGITLIPMPSNHSTERKYETTLHYIIETENERLLYATDGAWLLNAEHKIIGDKVFDASVFDATIGDEFEGDYRIFEHNSIEMVRLMVKTLTKTGRLRKGTPVFLTHFARTLHPSQKEIEASLKPPFVACYDGLEARIQSH